MKWLFGSLLVMLASVALTLVVTKDNGYVLIGYGTWTVEGSLALFILMNLALFILIHVAIRGLARVWAVPKGLREWKQRRRASRARRSLTRGLIELAEGAWWNAEQSLLKNADSSETPLLNYLAAARAAQQQEAYERRDGYLRIAHESMPSADIAVGLTQAELQIAHDQMEHALATLTHLHNIAPKHKYVLKMLKSLYQQLGEWQQLDELMPELRRQKVLPTKELFETDVLIQGHLLEMAGEQDDEEKLLQHWKGLTKTLQSHPSLVYKYVCIQVGKGRGSDVVDLVRTTVNQQWDDGLVRLYGQLDGKEPIRMLAHAEEWLSQHPNDANLLLALGRLSLRGRLWGKARNYLEASLGGAPSAEAYRELGSLLERLDEGDKAAECYRKGLELATNGQSPEPLAVPSLLGAPSLITSSETVPRSLDSVDQMEDSRLVSAP
jgi:HemY protein